MPHKNPIPAARFGLLEIAAALLATVLLGWFLYNLVIIASRL